MTDEEIETVMHQVPLTQQGESQVIDVWRRYIAQRTSEEGASGQFEAMEKMIQSYWSNDQQKESSHECRIKGNRYYCEVWLKYVRQGFIDNLGI